MLHVHVKKFSLRCHADIGKLLSRNRCSRAPERFFASTQPRKEQPKPSLINIVDSPFPPIATQIDTPLTEFIAKDWFKQNKKDGTNLSDKRAIIDTYTGQSRTFQTYFDDMGAIAASLKDEFDIGVDSVVALFSPNHVDYVPITLAVATCGAKLTPINPQFKSGELETILKRSQSEILIVHWSIMDVALEAVRGSKTAVRHIITIPEDDDAPVPGSTISLTTLKKNNSSPPLHWTTHVIQKNTATHPFLLPYSSGTTGLPKAVCLSHFNLISNLLQLESVEGSTPLFQPDQGHKLISPLPFFHIYGFLVSALYAAWKGHEIITMSSRFDFESFCQAIETHRPHRAHLVPPIILQLAKNPIVDKYDLSSLNMIISGAAPLSKDTEDALTKRIGCRMKQAWGMSELSPVGTITSDDHIKSGSVGQLASNTYGKVISLENGRNLPPNEEGELVIKGPQVMMGYLNDSKKTSECLSHDSGWLKTGDVAKYDEEGFFYITDRIKELIKVRGYQVFPAELEALLVSHPFISDAAVIPVDDEYSGQLPRAYVTMKNTVMSKDVCEHDIQEWVKERVAPFKRLEGGVRFINVIPKSASGKILRRVLVDQMKMEEVKAKVGNHS